MRITHALLLPALATAVGVLGGCVTPPDLSDLDLDCTLDSKNPKAHWITYGIKSQKTTLEVKEKVRVKQQTALVFKLKPQGSNPDGVSYANVPVTIVGKTTADKVWMPAKTSEGANSLIAFCAPSVTEDTTYGYEVHVDEFGMLDPRVDVRQ